MLDRSTKDNDEGARSSSVFMDALGLDAAELEVLGKIFVELAGPLGLDRDLFARLSSGSGLASALKLPAGAVELLYARAHHFFAAGRIERAGDLFRALLVLDGGSADNWIGYGVCLRMQDRPEEAMAAFQTASRIRPRWAVARFHSLDLAMRRGEWDLAGRLLEEFEDCPRDGLPEEISAEAAKLRTALELRRGALAEGVPGNEPGR